jgi:hypothetical protein
MMLFPPREAMTTAEPPEPLTLQHSDSIMNKQNLQKFDGPAVRHSCPIVSISGSISIILVTAWPLQVFSVFCGFLNKDM